MEILKCQLEDLETLFQMYDIAIAYQKTVFEKQWEYFDPEQVTREIEAGLHWKVIIDQKLAAVFLISEADEQLWKEKAIEPAVYLHRIVTHPDFRGRGLMQVIVDWANDYCNTHAKPWIRIDTWGDNQRLIDYYSRFGFQHIDTIDLADLTGYPVHYKGQLALLEMEAV